MVESSHRATGTSRLLLAAIGKHEKPIANGHARRHELYNDAVGRRGAGCGKGERHTSDE